MKTLENFLQENWAHCVAFFMGLMFVVAVIFWVVIEIAVARRIARRNKEKAIIEFRTKKLRG